MKKKNHNRNPLKIINSRAYNYRFQTIKIKFKKKVKIIKNKSTIIFFLNNLK